MRVLATYSIKGGVGKTATAVNLAHLAASGGARTLVWDLDPQGATSFYFRVKPRLKGGARRLIRGKGDVQALIRGTDYELLDLLPADFSNRNLDLFLDHARKPRKRLARLLRPLGGDYDYLFLDCAPGISLVSESIFVAADALLVPTIPTTLSLRALRQLRKALKDVKGRRRPALLPFLSLVDRRKSLHRKICHQAAGEGDAFLEARIPYASEVEQMGPRRAPLTAFAPRSAPGRAYAAMWAEIRSTLEDAG